MIDYEKLHGELLQKIKANLPELEALLEKVNGHWNGEDGFYRFYHYSFKCYYLQSSTLEIVEALKKLAPEGWEMNSTFETIYKEGTGIVFKSAHNKNWLKHTRPILEAFSHAEKFLSMVVKYGKEFEKAPECLPNGWALVLYFYGMR